MNGAFLHASGPSREWPYTNRDSPRPGSDHCRRGGPQGHETTIGERTTWTLAVPLDTETCTGRLLLGVELDVEQHRRQNHSGCDRAPPMKRYFTFQTMRDMVPPYQPRSFYHYMSLPESGYICVLEDGDAEPHTDWTELPHLLEATAANFNGVNATAGAYIAPPLAAGSTAQPAPTAIAGITHTDTTFQVAKKLATINRHFHP